MSLLSGLRPPWRPEPSPTESRELLPEETSLASVRVWIFSGVSEREVELRLLAARVSDSLNHAAGLLIRELGDHSEAWTPISRGDVLLVVPPEQPTDRLQRLHRMARRVRIVVGPYEVVGNAHVQPGADPAAFLRRHGRAFVPLTNASLRRGADELGVVPSVVVNLREATQVATPDASLREIAHVPLAT